MKKKFLSFAFIASMLLTGFSFTSCSDDDDDPNIPHGFETEITIENVVSMKNFIQSGTFHGAGENGLIMPGESAQFTFSGAKGQALMFAMMYGKSNDLFFAPENPGIGLFHNDGRPLTGDISGMIHLWDNGSRINQPLNGEITHPGEVEDGVITKIGTRDAQGNLYAAASELVGLQLAFDDVTSVFTLTITNKTTGTQNETPLSPGAWAIANLYGGEMLSKAPIFEEGNKTSAQLTFLAESGNNQPLASLLKENTGIITHVSPVIVVVYSGDINPIYQLGQKDANIGLKELSQTGNGAKLRDSLRGMANVRTVYLLGGEAITPGGKTSIKIQGMNNDKIAYATMFGYSNDWFYTNGETILANFKGDLTSKTVLLDNGTAVSQYPGAGYSQAVFRGTPIAEDKVISRVGNEYPVPAVNEVIKITTR